MVRHGTALQKFCSYKTGESLQVEPQSNSNFYGSARRGTTYKTGLIKEQILIKRLIIALGGRNFRFLHVFAEICETLFREILKKCETHNCLLS